MTFLQKKSRVLDWGLDILGAFIQAFGVWCFIEPAMIAPGGASGIALLIVHLTNLPVGTMTLLVNIPLLILSYFFLGKKTTLRTIRTILIMTVVLDYIVAIFVPQYTGDRLMGSLVGGILVGGGVALIFMRGSTTGGSDILGKLLQKAFPYLHTGFTIMLVDAIVISLSVVVFGGMDAALYGVLSMICTTKTIDAILYGVNKGTMVLVSSKFNREIAETIMTELGRGTTFLKSIGGFSKKESEILMCIVDRKQFYLVKEIVDRYDRCAFVIASETREVYGEGFINDPREHLIENA